MAEARGRRPAKPEPERAETLPPPVVRILGVFFLAIALALTWWAWDSAVTEGTYSPKAVALGPFLIVFALGVIIHAPPLKAGGGSAEMLPPGPIDFYYVLGAAASVWCLWRLDRPDDAVGAILLLAIPAAVLALVLLRRRNASR